MGRTDLGSESIRGQPAIVRLQPFLQRRLVIFGERRLRAGATGLLNHVFELALDEALRRFDAAVKIDRGDERLVAVRDQRVLTAAAGLFLAAPENQKLSEVDLV